eukprot:m51a1_g5222 hypothetical protein (548) ;mRNA; r:271336-273067
MDVNKSPLGEAIRAHAAVTQRLAQARLDAPAPDAVRQLEGEEELARAKLTKLVTTALSERDRAAAELEAERQRSQGLEAQLSFTRRLVEALETAGIQAIESDASLRAEVARLQASLRGATKERDDNAAATEHLAKALAVVREESSARLAATALLESALCAAREEFRRHVAQAAEDAKRMAAVRGAALAALEGARARAEAEAVGLRAEVAALQGACDRVVADVVACREESREMRERAAVLAKGVDAAKAEASEHRAARAESDRRVRELEVEVAALTAASHAKCCEVESTALARDQAEQRAARAEEALAQALLGASRVDELEKLLAERTSDLDLQSAAHEEARALLAEQCAALRHEVEAASARASDVQSELERVCKSLSSGGSATDAAELFSARVAELLSAASTQRARAERAEAMLQKAVQGEPGGPEASSDYGRVLRELNKLTMQSMHATDEISRLRAREADLAAQLEAAKQEAAQARSSAAAAVAAASSVSSRGRTALGEVRNRSRLSMPPRVNALPLQARTPKAAKAHEDMKENAQVNSSAAQLCM